MSFASEEENLRKNFLLSMPASNYHFLFGGKAKKKREYLDSQQPTAHFTARHLFLDGFSEWIRFRFVYIVTESKLATFSIF